MLLGELLRQGRDGDGVLEQTAEVGVVARARAWRQPPRGAQLAVRQHQLEQSPVARLVNLAREVLEKAVELVEVAIGDRQEAGRVETGAGRSLDPFELDLKRIAEASDASGDRDQLAGVEAPTVEIRIAEDSRRQRPAAIAELERQIGRPAARQQSLLARAGEHPSTASPARSVASGAPVGVSRLDGVIAA